MTARHQLSDLQLSIMWILWDRREATVSQVHDDLGSRHPLAPTTVATMLSRLEKRRLIAHRTEGRQFVYRPLVSETDVRRSMVAELTDRLFQGDATALVSHLLSSKEIADGDVARVKALLEERERALDAGDGGDDER